MHSVSLQYKHTDMDLKNCWHLLPSRSPHQHHHDYVAVTTELQGYLLKYLCILFDQISQSYLQDVNLKSNLVSHNQK